MERRIHWLCFQHRVISGFGGNVVFLPGTENARGPTSTGILYKDRVSLRQEKGKISRRSVVLSVIIDFSIFTMMSLRREDMRMV